MKRLSLWSLGLLTGLCFAATAPMVADTPEQCEARWSACYDKADGDVTACYDRCDARHPDLGPKWDQCYDACDATSDADLDRCDAQEDACLDGKPLNQTPAPPKPAGGGATAPAPGMIYGSKQSGQDGCYFGECAGDIPSGGSPQPQPQPQPTQPQPYPQQPYPQQPQVPVVKTTSICQTPTFWCQTFDRGAVGSSCYCNSPFGPVMGMAVAEK